MIDYRIHASGKELDLEQAVELYRASTLGERRPVGDLSRMRRMMENANLVVSAWDGYLMVGVARSLSDFAYATYLSDLAVRLSYQRRGIGKELIRQTQHAGGEAKVILISAPKAVDYYPRIGMTRHPSCWTLDAGQPLVD